MEIGRFESKRRGSKEEIQVKVEELVKIKEELKNAEQNSTRSWLASRPLTEKLEKLKSSLEIVKNRMSMSNSMISDLRSELEAISKSIKSKLEEELNAKKMSDELTETLNSAHKEFETIKRELNEKCRERSKQKRIWRLKKKKLQTLQATLRAVEMEIEAFKASLTEVVDHIKNSETENIKIQITQEEYLSLLIKAKDETDLAEWRISLFTKQKLAAEVSRNLCLSRLMELRRNKVKGKDHNTIEEVDEHRYRQKGRIQAANTLNQGLETRRRSRNSSRTTDKMISKRKNRSILIQVRRFLVRNMKSLLR